MTPIEAYFPRIFLINLRRRFDRLTHAMGVLSALGIDPDRVTIFEGYDKPTDHDGRPNGNFGCTSSHRALLEIIAHEKIERALVLEDDFDIAFTDPHQKTLVDAQALFASMVPEIPQRWDMLYLGGHYGETPVSRVSPHIVKIGRMLTTSSYGITCDFARRIAPHVCGIGPIDTLLGGFHRANDCYCVDPRLFIQYTNHSDLTDKEMNNSHCMQDMNHLRAMDAGTTYG